MAGRRRGLFELHWDVLDGGGARWDGRDRWCFSSALLADLGGLLAEDRALVAG